VTDDVTWPRVIGSDLEVSSFEQKSPGSGCRRPKSRVYCTFLFLQGCSSQEVAVTWQEMTSRDLRWPEVTRKWRHLPGSGWRRPKTPVYCTFHILQGCSSQEKAVTWQEMTWRDLSWADVTWNWSHLTGSHLKVAVENHKLAYTVHFTSYKAVARRRRLSRHSKLTSRDLKRPEVIWKWRHLTRSHLEVAVESQNLPILYISLPTRRSLAGGGSHVTENDVTWPQVTGSDPEVTSFDWKSPGSGCRRPKTRIYCTFHFLQGCSSQGEAVTWQEMISRDLGRPEVTRKLRHLTRSHLEVALEGKEVAYTVHFTSYKAVARRRWQSRDRKWCHMTSGDQKWSRSDVICLEVTWSGWTRPKTPVYCTFHILQGCSSQEKAVTRQEMTWHDLSWPDVTWNLNYLTAVTRKWL